MHWLTVLYKISILCWPKQAHQRQAGTTKTTSFATHRHTPKVSALCKQSAPNRRKDRLWHGAHCRFNTVSPKKQYPITRTSFNPFIQVTCTCTLLVQTAPSRVDILIIFWLAFPAIIFICSHANCWHHTHSCHLTSYSIIRVPQTLESNLRMSNACTRKLVSCWTRKNINIKNLK